MRSSRGAGANHEGSGVPPTAIEGGAHQTLPGDRCSLGGSAHPATFGVTKKECLSGIGQPCRGEGGAEASEGHAVGDWSVRLVPWVEAISDEKYPAPRRHDAGGSDEVTFAVFAIGEPKSCEVDGHGAGV